MCSNTKIPLWRLKQYLFQVLSEGFRLGCFSASSRNCTKDWKIPGESFVIRKDMKVLIPIVSMSLTLSDSWSGHSGWTSSWSPVLARSFQVRPWEVQCGEQEEYKGNHIPALWIRPKVKKNFKYKNVNDSCRSCLGQNLIKMETKVMLIQLLKNFK